MISSTRRDFDLSATIPAGQATRRVPLRGMPMSGRGTVSSHPAQFPVFSLPITDQSIDSRYPRGPVIRSIMPRLPEWIVDGTRLSPVLLPFRDEVEFSHDLIDDPEAPAGDAPYNEATWLRAIRLAEEGMTNLPRIRQALVRSLEVSWAPEASIDLIFNSGSRELALNVPARSPNTAWVFSSGAEGFIRKQGSLGPSESLSSLLYWLTDLR